jgi:hypothetical protein
MYSGKKSTNESEGKPQEKFDTALGKIFRISKFSKKQAKPNISREQGRLKLINHFRMYKKYRFNCICLKKNIHLVTQSAFTILTEKTLQSNLTNYKRSKKQ